MTGRLARRFIVMMVSVLLSLPVLGDGITLIDDRGETVTLERPAQRIISLAPHVTELLFAAGAGERVVAVVEFSDYPPAARDLPSVGNASRVDLERVAAQAPDLVIGWGSGNDRGDLARIEARLGIPVYVSEIAAIADIPQAIEALGRLAGTTETAIAAADDFRARHDTLRQRHAGRAPVTVFYQIWERPLMTINDRNFIADSIRFCGGVNVFADIEPIAPAVSVEAVIAADPQVIINSASDDRNEQQLEAWRRWDSIRAVRDDNLYVIPSDLIVRPTPRILDGVARLCEILDQARDQSRVRGERQ